MIRPFRDTLFARGRSAPGRLIAVALALVLVGLLAQSAAALTDDEVDAKTKQRVKQCQNDGGTPTNSFEYNEDGSVESFRTICTGLGDGYDWNCYTYADGTSGCVTGYVRPTLQQIERASPRMTTGVLTATDATTPVLVPVGSLEPASDGQ